MSRRVPTGRAARCACACRNVSLFSASLVSARISRRLALSCSTAARAESTSASALASASSIGRGIEAHQHLARRDDRMVPDPDLDDAAGNFAGDLGDVGLDEGVLGGDVAAALQPERRARRQRPARARRSAPVFAGAASRRDPPVEAARPARGRISAGGQPPTFVAGPSAPETSVSLTRCSNAKSCLLSRAERSASAVSTVASATRQMRLCTRSASGVR